MSAAGFAMRSPWYVRSRDGVDLRSPAALRPTLQMYDDPAFVESLLRDPADSVAFGADDVWSYPVPVTPSTTDGTRLRLATYQLVATNLRKLYQPMHQRYYVVVVEVFCDQPGLPRAGDHEDLVVQFRMRRMDTTLTSRRAPARRVATALVKELAKQEGVTTAAGDPDVRDLWWADRAWRRRFEEDHREDLDALDHAGELQQWLVSPASPAEGRWRNVSAVDPVAEGEREEMHQMWRLPRRERDSECAAAETRSLWFGIVPAFSGEHWLAPQPDGSTRREPKLDDKAIYEIECVVTQPRPPGQEHCPPHTWVSAPTEPFRLATPLDPDGTKNRSVTLTLPDLRLLAARAGRPQGPGGVRVVTPPSSQLKFNPFNGIPESGAGRIGGGGGVCTFALELFFIVAFFLFLMFLPIVVLAFQLWFLLALRFCIPPSIGFSATADFIATGKLLAELDVGMQADLDIAFGSDFSDLAGANATVNWVKKLDEAKDPVSNQFVFKDDSTLTHALVIATDPSDVVPDTPAPHEPSPDDPLCPLPPPP